jgi:hypothetical protein
MAPAYLIKIRTVVRCFNCCAQRCSAAAPLEFIVPMRTEVYRCATLLAATIFFDPTDGHQIKSSGTGKSGYASSEEGISLPTPELMRAPASRSRIRVAIAVGTKS